jgi:hypothetical protein
VAWYGWYVDGVELVDYFDTSLDRTPPSVTAAASPSSAVRSSNPRNPSINVTVSGTVSDVLSGVDTSPGAGSYTITDNLGLKTFVPGTFTVAVDGTYSFLVNLPLSNSSRGNRVFTITVRVKDRMGNLALVATTFTVT